MNSPHDVYMPLGVVGGLLLGTGSLIAGSWFFGGVFYVLAVWLIRLWIVKGRAA